MVRQALGDRDKDVHPMPSILLETAANSDTSGETTLAIKKPRMKSQLTRSHMMGSDELWSA